MIPAQKTGGQPDRSIMPGRWMVDGIFGALLRALDIDMHVFLWCGLFRLYLLNPLRRLGGPPPCPGVFSRNTIRPFERS